MNQASLGGEDTDSLDCVDTEFENSGAAHSTAAMHMISAPCAQAATLAFLIPDEWLQDLEASTMTQPLDIKSLSIQVLD